MTRAGNPRLRALEAFPVEQEGQRCVALRDPAGFTDQIAVLPPALLDLVSLFDGEHSVEEIREILRRRHGKAPTASRSPTSSSDSTPPASSTASASGSGAGRSRTPSAGARCARRPTRAAPTPATRRRFGRRSTASSPAPTGRGAPPARGPRLARSRGLIAPHIDFHRGGSDLRVGVPGVLERSDADLFVVLGTCHAGMPDPFAVTLKPYDTPLGPVPVDRDFFEALARRAGQDLLASEPAHRTEHSIEFQAVMLQHLVGPRRPFTILPVLASYLHESLWSGGDPEADPRVPRFLDALRETMAASARRVCLIAGVDLAHVGPRFGDPEPNTAASLARVERDDRAMLESVVAGDAARLLRGDRRRPRRPPHLRPLADLHAAAAPAGGRRAAWCATRQWPDPEGAVTFCAVAFP